MTERETFCPVMSTLAMKVACDTDCEWFSESVDPESEGRCSLVMLMWVLEANMGG